MGDKFDAIVIGAGIAGSSAAITMAKAGLQVLLLERGMEGGAKNLSGGVLWGNALDRVVPEWRQEAPLERYINNKRLGLLSPDSCFAMDFKSGAFDKPPYNGYTVLRAKLDHWLAKQAEKAGATLFTGVPVRQLARENGRVTGVIESGETIQADAVIIADGANSRLSLSEKLRDAPRFDNHQMELGIKEIIKLPQKTIEDRFHLQGNSGFAMECVLGFLKNGAQAGGFLYTNKDTLSLGVVVNLGSLKSANAGLDHRKPDPQLATYSYEIIEEFKTHPAIAPMLEGGEVVEYGARLIPNGMGTLLPDHWTDPFYQMVEIASTFLGISRAATSTVDRVELRGRLYGDGWLVAGDAAGFCFSNGFVIQGMNYAALSGYDAAQTLIEAKQRKDFSHRALSRYTYHLEQDHILSDFRRFKGATRAVWDPTVHSLAPSLLADIFKDIITEEGRPKQKMWQVMFRNAKKHGLLHPFQVVRLLRAAISGGLNL